MGEPMSLCLQCQSEIPLGARRCPYCTGDPTNMMTPFQQVPSDGGEPLGRFGQLVLVAIFLVVFIYIYSHMK